VSEYVCVLYKVVEYRAEVKVSAEDANEATKKARALYADDIEKEFLNLETKELNWVVNSKKLAEVGVQYFYAEEKRYE
jgi:hypothetical protein